MTLREMLPANVAIHHDYIDLEISPEDWEEQDGRLVLDLAEIKRREYARKSSKSD